MRWAIASIANIECCSANVDMRPDKSVMLFVLMMALVMVLVMVLVMALVMVQVMVLVMVLAMVLVLRLPYSNRSVEHLLLG